MNTRMRELAEKAGYYLYDLTETHGIKTVETDSKDEWITLEQFAELIVLECVSIADEYVRAGGNGAPARPTAKSLIGIEIQNHFGVEE